MVQDRYLQDYASVWKGPKDQTGMRDGDASQQYLQEYLKAMRKQTDAYGNFHLPQSNINGHVDSETGDMVLEGKMGKMQIDRRDLAALSDACLSAKPTEYQPPEQVIPSLANNGLSPQLKRNMEQAVKAMESWARSSAKSFPK